MSKELRDKFPYVGDTLIFTGVPKFYYPMFTNIGKKAAETFKLGEKYKVRKVEIYSSWCAVWFEGIGAGDELNDSGFHYQFFKKDI